MSRRKLTFIYLVLSFIMIATQACIRRPQGANGDSSPVDESFRITIEGNPATYIPGQTYNITLSCDPVIKFISFTMVVESESGIPYGALDMTGHFEIIDPAETRFSNLCENMIESSNTNIKHRIDVAWVAPTNPNSTCVYIKAAVLQHRNVWYIDDGLLTRKICAEEIDDVNSQTPLVDPCCACDEAKYELRLERLWMRNTHPKDFPPDDWRTRFSELIGASHSFDYRFWAYGSNASQGLKELAEHGATTTLENEIKEHSETGTIRTIIKAPGVPFRKNVISSTLATVRVDKIHHIVSIVTKIIPSPDWILGVAGLELCLMNCTWIDEKVLNLFPWDIGTDSGPSYMSPDQQQVPADVVRRITSSYPSDFRSPFYDETHAPMKPMARLTMTRKKIYERECEEDNNVPLECATHPWVNETECSSKCGPGIQYQVRNYKDLDLAARYDCKVVLKQTLKCEGQCALQEYYEDFGQTTAECELTNWSSWSACSQSCGRGFKIRTRNFRNPYAREKCQSGPPMKLEEKEDCSGNACGGTITKGYGYDNNGFDEYSREPGLLEEDSYNGGSQYNKVEGNQYGSASGNQNSNNIGAYQYNNRENQFNTRQNRPTSFNEKWNVDDSYGQANFGDIDQNGFGTNIGNNEQQQNTNFGFNGNNDGNMNFGEIGGTKQPYNYGYGKNKDDNYNVNRFKNEHWLGNNDNNLNNENFGFDNGNNNQQESNSMITTGYNQIALPESVTNRFKSPGFNVPPQKTQVVQDFCFEKPFVVLKNCPGKKVISNFWFYDADDRKCKIFTTDNCDENKNKFTTLEACEGDCLEPLGRQFNNAPNEQNNWPNQFEEQTQQTQLRPTNSYGRRQQNYNQFNQLRQRNRNY